MPSSGSQPDHSTASQTAAPDTVIALDQVRKTFADGKKRLTALDGVSAAIGANRVTGLIGPDGAGKTTLMRLCAGLLTPDQGQLTVLGINAVQEPLRVQATIGYMPQRFGLYEDLSVQENMELYADLQGVPEEQRPDRYEQLLTMAGLSRFVSRLAGKLSGGMKQKLGLVCTLVRPPRLLLLDEPTVGVDPVSRRELWNIVYHLVEQEGMSVLLSTAYLDEAERCAEVVLMHQGQILGQDHPAGFSARVKGRTWVFKAQGLSKRDLQQQLSSHPDVLDALILGTSVRVVMRTVGAPGSDLLPEAAHAEVRPVEPRFEDYFIATLKGKGTDDGAKSSIILHRQERRFAGTDVITVNDLVRRFGDFHAVDHVSFQVKSGEIFGLLGANGAGKTTTFRMLCGLLPISSGSCSVAGANLRTASATARARIGYMAQRFSLYGNLTVLQNLKFFSSAYGLQGKQRARQIEWALATFHLGPYAGSDSQTLPLGFKQRLALAVALMHEPDVLFLDEPTSGVDPLARRDFWTQINSLAEQGVTVLVTTHFMEEAEYCDRLVIMADGRVLAEGTPEALKDQCPGSTDGRETTMEDAFILLLEANRAKTEAP